MIWMVWMVGRRAGGLGPWWKRRLCVVLVAVEFGITGDAIGDKFHYVTGGKRRVSFSTTPTEGNDRRKQKTHIVVAFGPIADDGCMDLFGMEEGNRQLGSSWSDRDRAEPRRLGMRT